MKAYLIFSPSEPILIVTRQTIRSKAVLDHLDRIGVVKFIAREVPISPLRSQYGRQFDVIEGAIEKGGDLRVLDYRGDRIFQNLPFSTLGPAYRRESRPAVADVTQESTSASFRPNLGSVSPIGLG